jgi:hypothetical protein
MENEIDKKKYKKALDFQMIVCEGDTEPTMTLSKYDYKNKKFLEHYKCDVEFTNID